MAYRYEEESGDLIIDGWEQGIAASPHKGIANIQNANISTQINEVMASFARAQQTMTDTTATGSLAFVDSSHVSLSIAGTNNLFKGNWITVTGSSNTTQLPNGTYYVPPSTGSNFQLANYYNAMSYTPASVAISTLVVGGGGGGGGATGNSAAGGGGAGGVKTGTGSVQTSVGYSITIGTGGGSNSNGSSSVLSGGSLTTVTADGGGGGGNGVSSSGDIGLAGASGGGGGAQTNAVGGGGGAGTAGEGNNGGSAANNTTIQGGGGGGGAGAVGNDKRNSVGVGGGGDGGVGISSSITGTATFYGGGGGGACNNGSGLGGGAGGNGGGGVGNNSGSPSAGAGAANTGGGGGGGNTSGASGGSGVVIISAPLGQITATGGTHTTTATTDVWTFTSSGTWTPTILPITVPSLVTGFTTGLTANFTMVATIGKPIAQATEQYYASGVPYHRYYVLDANNLVWVYDDQNEVLFSSTDNVNWFLPDYVANYAVKASGIGVISGFLIVATEHGMFGKPVVALGNTNTQATTWVQFPDDTGWQGSERSVNTPHFCFVGHQGIMYVTDASYILSLFPDSTIADSTGAATADNVQTLCSWTNDSIDPTHTIDFSIISGVTPVTSDGKRLPVVFFTTNNGVLPNAITTGTVYYIQSTILASNVYATSGSSTQLDMQTGASGPQYFSAFYPTASAASSIGATPLEVLTGQRLTLPKFEIAQCIAEIGNNVLIGCTGSVVYPWDQVQNLPQGLISLPESNTVNILTVNQMGYIFTGNKGNVYLTDGSQASEVISVPDYTAGVPGSPATYIEPQFTWGGAGYVRGRIYFSIQDQTATKAGNCGGIWSFIPTQNLYIGQDVGISLRLEAQNSYGSYNGTASLIIPRQNQVSGPPLYWTAWASSVSSPLYGIDYSSTSTLATSIAVIETDAIPVGTFLDKKTFKQVEYKLATPLLNGESVTISYRGNLTDAWASMDTANTESGTVSGYFSENTERLQWLQLRITLTPQTGSTGSFVRVRELRIR